MESDLVGDGSRSNPFIFEIGGVETGTSGTSSERRELRHRETGAVIPAPTPQTYRFYQSEFRKNPDGTFAHVGVGQFAERAHREKLIAAIAPAGSGHPYLDPKQWHVDMVQTNTRKPGSRASYTDGAFGMELELQNKVTLGSGLPARAEIRFNHVNRPYRTGFRMLTLAIGRKNGLENPQGLNFNNQVRILRSPAEAAALANEERVVLVTMFNRFRYAIPGTPLQNSLVLEKGINRIVKLSNDNPIPSTATEGAKLVDGLPNPPRIGMHTIVIAARARHISEYSLFDGEGKLKDRGVVGRPVAEFPLAATPSPAL